MVAAAAGPGGRRRAPPRADLAQLAAWPCGGSRRSLRRTCSSPTAAAQRDPHPRPGGIAAHGVRRLRLRPERRIVARGPPRRPAVGRQPPRPGAPARARPRRPRAGARHGRALGAGAVPSCSAGTSTSATRRVPGFAHAAGTTSTTCARAAWPRRRRASAWSAAPSAITRPWSPRWPIATAGQEPFRPAAKGYRFPSPPTVRGEPVTRPAPRFVPVAAVCVTLAAGLLAACGSSDSSSDTAAAPEATTAPATTAPAKTATEPKTATVADAEGKKVFVTAGCAGCHTLSAAGASGQVGPNLDQLLPQARRRDRAGPGRDRRQRDAGVQGPALAGADQGRRGLRVRGRRAVARGRPGLAVLLADLVNAADGWSAARRLCGRCAVVEAEER